jgi:RNA recognition motif-containing protein
LRQERLSFRTTKEANLNLYVGNLARAATEAELEELFTPFGQVESVTIIKDKFSGESRGFAFVEMPDSTAALAAISGLANTELLGRRLTVNEARPRTDDRRGGGGRRS